MKCKDCHKNYVGQRGSIFKTRYKEHIHSIRTNNTNTKYAEHILDTQHTYAPITDTMDILHIEKKGRLMNTWEKFYIHKLSKNNLQLNGTYTDMNNPNIWPNVQSPQQGKSIPTFHSSPHHTSPDLPFTPQRKYKYQYTQKTSDTCISNIDNTLATKRVSVFNINTSG
jgi:hypothetical protein